MGHLYYTELGNVQGGPLTNTGPFTSLQSDSYWLDTDYDPNPNRAWYFYFGNGYQNAGFKDLYYFAWAVRPCCVGSCFCIRSEQIVPHNMEKWSLIRARLMISY